MKKYLTLIICAIVVVSAIFGISLYKKVFTKTPEDMVNKFKTINCYECDISYEIFNKRNNKVEYASITSKGSKDVKIKFNDGRQMIYKEDEILLSNDLTEEEYHLSKDFDRFYCLATIENIRQAILSNGKDMKISYHEGNNLGFIDIAYNIYDNNKEINRAVISIDSKKAIPVEAKIYDDNDNITMVITYNNFVVNKRIK